MATNLPPGRSGMQPAARDALLAAADHLDSLASGGTAYNAAARDIRKLIPSGTPPPRYQVELATLRNECFILATPLALGTDGTTHSAAHHIRTYVRHLEQMVAELAVQLAEFSDDEAVTEENQHRAERFQAQADLHVTRGFGERQ